MRSLPIRRLPQPPRHGYVDVKLNRVWQVLDRDLSPLREAVQIELGRHLDQ